MTTLKNLKFPSNIQSHSHKMLMRQSHTHKMLLVTVTRCWWCVRVTVTRCWWCARVTVTRCWWCARVTVTRCWWRSVFYVSNAKSNSGRGGWWVLFSVEVELKKSARTHRRWRGEHCPSCPAQLPQSPDQDQVCGLWEKITYNSPFNDAKKRPMQCPKCFDAFVLKEYVGLIHESKSWLRGEGKATGCCSCWTWWQAHEDPSDYV